jgi:hypothetical protein
MRPVPIPISQAKRIADEFGYDQVMIYARKVDRPAGVGETASQAIQGGEHMTTYGIDAKNCAAAAQIGDFLKFKIMGWNEEETHEDRRYEALTKALTEAERFMSYFANETDGHFSGDGTPTTCLAEIRAALAQVKS